MWRGTQTIEFQGIPATGRKVEIGSLNFDRIEKGKIVEHRAIFDALGMLQQLGAIPTPEEARA